MINAFFFAIFFQSFLFFFFLISFPIHNKFLLLYFSFFLFIPHYFLSSLWPCHYVNSWIFFFFRKFLRIYPLMIFICYQIVSIFIYCFCCWKIWNLKKNEAECFEIKINFQFFKFKLMDEKKKLIFKCNNA